MAKTQKYTVKYRRKREGKTDYKKRLSLLASGKLRLVIRRSLKNIWLQVIEYSAKGDIVLASAHSRELIKHGWKGARSSLPTAYLCGLLLGKKASAKGIKEAVLDIGMNVSVKGGIWYAALKGCTDAGLKVPCAQEVIPKPERISGKHICEWAKKLKAEPEKYRRTFSTYLKSGLAPEDLAKHFEDIKTKVTSK